MMLTRDVAAYSRLSQLLRERNWTVADLLRHLQEQGVRVDRKTLYRLTSSSPVGKADIALVHRICDVLDIGLDDFFRFAPPLPNGEPDEFWELPVAKVQRLNELGQRNNQGELTAAERRELADLVAEYETLAYHNAQVRLWRDQPRRFPDALARAAKA
jgi:hypothetical protein